MPVRLVIGDDQTPFRLAACQWRVWTPHGFTVVGEGWTGKASIHAARELDPDFTSMDLIP